MYRKLFFIAAVCAACFARAQTGSVISVGEYVAGEDWTGEQIAPVAVLATNTAVALTNLEERVGVLETNPPAGAVSWGALTNTGVGTIVADGIKSLTSDFQISNGGGYWATFSSGGNTSWTALMLAGGLFDYASGAQWLPSWTIADMLTNHVAAVAGGLTGLVWTASAAGTGYVDSVASGLTGLVSAASVAGTGYVDSVAGMLPSYASVSNIAASAQGLLGTYYGYGSIASDLAGYHVLSNAFGAAGTYHAVTNAGVTNLQYVAQFATANSRITAQPESTVHVKFWAGLNTGGGRAAAVNVELYVLTTNGTTIVEFAGTTPQALGALTYCEFDVPISSNLVFTQTIRYAAKVKVTSQNANPNVFIYSEDGRPFMVEIPLSSGQFAFQSDFAALDSRVTALEARPSGGSTIYRPLVASTTNIVVTSTQSIYRVTASVAQTNNCIMTGLNTTNQAASFEVWYNAETTNALNVVWPANWTFETGTPEMTVTGQYRFACTTLNGTTASVRQVYPTPCWYQDLPVGDPINANSVSVGLMYQNAWLGATTGTSVYFVASHPMPARAIKLKMRLREYDEIATNSVQVWIGAGNMALVAKGAYERNLRWVDSADAYNDIDEILAIPASTGNLTGGNCRGIRIDLTRTNAVGRLNFNGCEWCPMNELEQAAYAAGWRP